MLRLTRWLTALLGFALLAANSASAVAAFSGQNPASGSLGSLEHRLGQNSLASADRLSEKLASLYDFASDFPVAARGAASAANVANKVNHIFRDGKNLEGLVRASGGSAEAAYGAVQSAANEALRKGLLSPAANGVLPGAGAGAVLNVNGVHVQLIGGRVINGVVHIGSFVGL